MEYGLASIRMIIKSSSLEIRGGDDGFIEPEQFSDQPICTGHIWELIPGNSKGA